MEQEPTPTVQNQQTENQPQDQANIHSFPKKSMAKDRIIFIVAGLLLLAGAAFGFWKYQSNLPKNNNNYSNNNSNQGQLNPTPTPIPTDTVYNDTSNSNYPATPPVCKNPGPILASKSGLVQWVAPQATDIGPIFAAFSPNSEYGSDNTTLVGKFIGGPYQSADLYMTTLNYNAPGGPSIYFIARSNNTWTVLGKYSDQLPDPTDIKPVVHITVDQDFDLPDLDFPQTIHSDNPSADFTLATNLGFYKNGTQDFCADNYRKVFTDPNVGDVYTDAGTEPVGTGQYSYYPMFGFYVKAPDGMRETYQLSINFIGQDKVPLVSWNNNKKNAQEYSYQAVGGCGASQFLDVQNVKLSDLKQIGTTFDGQVIYGYKNTAYASTTTEGLSAMYDEIGVPEGQTKPNYAQFLADNPVFFWQDPFGQFVRFKIMKYQPLAECAKPVIYLYPQKTENVSVKIDPQGGMTKSDPAYNTGWNVLTDPFSNITNLADGQIYPYLFWEGRGGIYQTPSQGFVVEKTNIHEFLTNKLHELGLNEKESADFIQFWQPKMQSSPYYFVTFMGNSVMDLLAPLTIFPKPDTVIRVLMDFTPLDHPETVQGYNIHTPQRKGFTVVEWGGVLR